MNLVVVIIPVRVIFNKSRYTDCQIIDSLKRVYEGVAEPDYSCQRFTLLRFISAAPNMAKWLLDDDAKERVRENASMT